MGKKRKEFLLSRVPGFEGACKPVWLNKNIINCRTAGGVTGFFRLIKVGWFGRVSMLGEEFHGVIIGSFVLSMERQKYEKS